MKLAQTVKQTIYAGVFFFFPFFIMKKQPVNASSRGNMRID